MKKLIIAFLFITISVSLIAQSKKDTKGFLPKEFKNLYFGMPFETFLEVKDLGMVEVNKGMEFRLEYSEKPGGFIKEVVYYFDREGGGPLYELIIEYQSATKRDEEEIKSIS